MEEGSSPMFRRVLETADRYARSQWPVLLEGETGSGKEVLARRVHERSRRRLCPFVPINCGAMPAGLFESELFGSERGAFSGAVASTRGLARQANGGTLFLDEVGELELSLQTKLLRFLDSGEVRSVGSSKIDACDVRIVAATNVPLLDAVRAGRFRLDLYERLSVLLLAVPPLRARREDILPLARHWLQRIGEEATAATLEPLLDYDWPGNVRQLRNLLVRASVRSGGELQSRVLREVLAEEKQTARSREREGDVYATASLDDIERHVICARLKVYHGNRKRTAEALGIAKSTLQDKLRKWRVPGRHDELDDAEAHNDLPSSVVPLRVVDATSLCLGEAAAGA